MLVKASVIVIYVIVKTLQDHNSHPSQSASPIYLSTEQNTAFVHSNSNVRVVRLITRFDAERFASHPQVINQPAPSCSHVIPIT